MNRKGFAPVVVVLIVVGILIVGGIWYYEAHKNTRLWHRDRLGSDIHERQQYWQL
ncbi:MAG: hypothetical protein ABSE18_00605 [Minisyncoccia bacterium]|jgi:uncharacterized protein (DUF983 family)